MTVREILDAICGLPRPDRLRIVEELNREIVDVPPAESEKLGPHMEERGRLLVYTGPLLDPALEDRIDQLISRLNAGRV